MSSLPNSVDAFKAYVIDLVESSSSWRRPEFEGISMKFATGIHLSNLLAENGRHFDHLSAIDHSFRSLSATHLRDFRIMVTGDKSLVFLMALHSGMSTPSLLGIIQTTSLRDDSLPFTTGQRPGVVPTSEWGSFMSSQELLAPLCLRLNNFEMQSSCIPIHGSFETGGLASGSTGHVFKATISNTYHSFTSIQNGTDNIVVKAIEDESDADSEKHVLKNISQLSTSQQTHIAKIFAGFTFTKNGAYYLVSEPADCNFEDFMQQNPTTPRPDHINFSWLLAQFRGLANAFHAIHTGIPGKSVAHRDIKPANILVFTDPNSSTGSKVLKITDWGSATSDLHEPNTAPRSPRSCINVDPPYYAPECRNDGLSSRKQDVWSLGCVVMEALIWWNKGWEYLVEWRVRRNEGNEEGFWKDGKDELLDQVEDELEWLVKNGFGNMRRVIAEMLRFEEEKRLTAEEVARRV